jgi:hypothetical protein
MNCHTGFSRRGSVFINFADECLLGRAEADFHGQAQNKVFEYLCRFRGQVGRKEAIVTAAGEWDQGSRPHGAVLIRRLNTISVNGLTNP